MQTETEKRKTASIVPTLCVGTIVIVAISIHLSRYKA